MKTTVALATTAITLLFAGTAMATPPKMNGRYVRGAGEETPKIKAGTSSGNVGFEPYSGSYLPRHEGPMMKEKDEEVLAMITDGFDGCDLVHKIIKDNAAKSTAAKFEKAIENSDGGNSTFAARYKAEGYDKKAETWEGFCHNWAPAGLDKTINFMVSMDKIYADVPFGIGDLRELATWNYPGEAGWGDAVWFGSRWDDKDAAEPKDKNFDPVDLITIMKNYVGKGKPGIVFDVDPGYMVWNQPFYKWNMKTTEATAAAHGPKKAPAGGKAFKVKLNATYGLEGHYAYRGETNTNEKTWYMWVYADKNGNIVDSAWNTDEYSDEIPDFAWMNKKIGTNDEFEKMKAIAKEGVSVKDIETFCAAMASLPHGKISAANASKLKKLLDKICPVLDQNKVNKLVRDTARRIGQDYTVVDGAIRSETPGHV